MAAIQAAAKNMNHTESYIDHESVDSNLHMVSLAGNVEGKDTFVWAVWENRKLLTEYQERLRTWFLNEIGALIGQGETEILKELVRVSSGLKCRLYLYCDQKLYRAGDRVEEGEYIIEPPLGASIHKEGQAMSLPLQKELEQMKKELAQSPSCVSEGEVGIQTLGNIWQRNIMDCIAQDSLSYAYFMLWEAR